MSEEAGQDQNQSTLIICRRDHSKDDPSRDDVLAAIVPRSSINELRYMIESRERMIRTLGIIGNLAPSDPRFIIQQRAKRDQEKYWARIIELTKPFEKGSFTVPKSDTEMVPGKSFGPSDKKSAIKSDIGFERTIPKGSVFI